MEEPLIILKYIASEKIRERLKANLKLIYIVNWKKKLTNCWSQKNQINMIMQFFQKVMFRFDSYNIIIKDNRYPSWWFSPNISYHPMVSLLLI